MSGATKLMTAGGGGVSLTPASSIASDVTVNVPSQNCTLGIQGPAFSAYRSTNQTGISSGVATKVQLVSELFDTANCFDSSTNYRFTPNVAGYYQINYSVYMSGTNLQYPASSIYKNGTAYSSGGFGNTAQGDWGSAGSNLVYFNGTTDYVELYVTALVSSGTVTVNGSQELTWLSGTLVRAA